MIQPAVANSLKPAMDERPLWDLIGGILAYKAVLVAHHLKLFSLLNAALWNDPFPVTDVHFYADIYHDWPPEKGRFLTKKSFDSLPSGGRIIIHEMLYNVEKTGPLMAAAYSVAMLLWTEGQQYSGNELSALLAEAGFADIEVQPSFGYWSIVTGRKP